MFLCYRNNENLRVTNYLIIFSIRAGIDTIESILNPNQFLIIILQSATNKG